MIVQKSLKLIFPSEENFCYMNTIFTTGVIFSKLQWKQTEKKKKEKKKEAMKKVPGKQQCPRQLRPHPSDSEASSW